MFIQDGGGCGSKDKQLADKHRYSITELAYYKIYLNTINKRDKSQTYV